MGKRNSIDLFFGVQEYIHNSHRSHVTPTNLDGETQLEEPVLYTGRAGSGLAGMLWRMQGISHLCLQMSHLQYLKFHH